MAKSTIKVLELLKKGVGDSCDVLLLTGDDEYLHDLVVKTLEAKFVDPDFRDFNLRKLDCTRSTTAGQIAGALSELPTLVDSRLVVLQRISQLTKAVSSRLVELWEGSIAPGTVVVLTAGGGVKDSPLWSFGIKLGLQVDCRLAEKDIDVLLKSFCRKQGKKIGPNCLAVLKERVGLDLRSLLSHLERCLLSLGPEEILSGEKVEKLVPFSAQVAMWKMTRAIGRRNHREALSILDNQLHRGEQPGSIFSYLNSYLVSLVQISGLIKQHKTASEVAKVLPRKTEFQVKKSLEELRTWSEKDFRDGFDALVRADFKCKGGAGGADPKLLLQMLVLKLCSRKRQTSR